MSATTAPTSNRDSVRVRAFIDFWNFQIALNRDHPNLRTLSRGQNGQLQVDWKKLGPWLAQQAGKVFLAAGQEGRITFEGLHLYLSHDPRKSSDDGLRRWATNTLDRFPGIQVVLKERKPKDPPKCPTCYEFVDTCPKCQSSMRRTVEKGIDTAIVTDMIRLAWEDSWDLAVLVTADADFIPAVEFLNQKGRKVIHGGFPPDGMNLAKKCWGSFDLTRDFSEVIR